MTICSPCPSAPTCLISQELTGSSFCSGSASFFPSLTLTVTRFMLAPVILNMSLFQRSNFRVTHPGSLTSTGETSSISAFPSPAFPDPYPVSSCSSLRAAVLHIRTLLDIIARNAYAASSPSSINPAGNSGLSAVYTSKVMSRTDNSSFNRWSVLLNNNRGNRSRRMM